VLGELTTGFEDLFGGLSVGSVEGVMTGRAAALPLWKQESIVTTARVFNVDPRLLAALALAEQGPQVTAPDGSTTGGVGCLPVTSYPTWADQVRCGAKTIQSNIDRYWQLVGSPYGPDGTLTEDFIRFMGGVGLNPIPYAPLASANDPTGLNQHWIANVTDGYQGSALA